MNKAIIYNNQGMFMSNLKNQPTRSDVVQLKPGLT